MPETFIELVPRCGDSLRQSMKELEASGVPFDGYNIPELVRSGQSFLRPEEVLQMRLDSQIEPRKRLALHLRTRERSVQETLNRISLAARHNVSIAVLVTGDPIPTTEDRCTYAHEVIASHMRIPSIRIGVAADLYQPDWGRWHQKVPAIGKNVDVVFTQPVFQPSLFAEINHRARHLLQPDHVYAGITWMTTERSRRYWHERNGVPLDHLPQGNSDAVITQNSIAQAADVLRTTREQGYSAYIMLMRSSVALLARVFAMAENVREV